MKTYIAYAVTGLLFAGVAAPVMAQTTPSNTTVEGSQSAPGNSSGGPSAATTTGNLSTTTTVPGVGAVQTPTTSIAPPANTSSNTVAQTPGSPANTGK